MLNQSISITQCLYSGLQLRNNQPPQILVQIHDRTAEVFNPIIHRLNSVNADECLNDLLSRKEAKRLIEDILHLYAGGEEGAIYIVAREHNIPMPEINGYIRILKDTGMIYPGMQLSQSPKGQRAAV